MAAPQSQQVLQRPYNTAFNGVDEEYGKSASLWLADIERHRERGSSPSQHLRNIDRQLQGEADRWAKSTPSVRIAILKAYGEEATESDVEALYRAMTQRFQLTHEDVMAIRNSRPQTCLLYLKQAATDDLRQYYSRTMGILTDLHGRDGNISTLTPLEMSVHGFAVECFVVGLTHQPLCSWLLLQNVLHPTRTLLEVYEMAVRKARIMASENKSEQEDGKEKEKEQDSREKGQQERKHKLDTELESSASAKKQIVPLKVPTATQHEEASSKSNTGGEPSLSGNHTEGGNVGAVPSKRLPAPHKSKPTPTPKPRTQDQGQVSSGGKRYPSRRYKSRTSEGSTNAAKPLDLSNFVDISETDSA